MLSSHLGSNLFYCKISPSCLNGRFNKLQRDIFFALSFLGESFVTRRDRTVCRCPDCSRGRRKPSAIQRYSSHSLKMMKDIFVAHSAHRSFSQRVLYPSFIHSPSFFFPSFPISSAILFHEPNAAVCIKNNPFQNICIRNNARVYKY